MKKLVLHTLFVVVSLSSFAQVELTRAEKSEFSDADFFFYQERYSEAYKILTELHKAHSNEPEIALRMAVCELELNKDISSVEELLNIALQRGNKEAVFHMARVKHRNHEFKEATSMFEEYKSSGVREVNDPQVNNLINACQQAIILTENPEDVLVRNLGSSINSVYAEYVPILTSSEDELYFTSRRENSTGGKLDPDDKYFEDVYYSKKENGTWTRPVNTLSDINTSSHDATAAISADGMKMVIYRTNRQLTGGDLYITEKKEKGWSEPLMLDKNINSEFQEASACFSPDGSAIYFSSNRPGGYGGKDIYRVRILPNGEWSLPKNLGPTVNTESNEDSPFIDVDDRTLYFASEGHNSMGGYDIFTSKRQGKEHWSSPENLGYPANSVGDDIYLSITPGGRKGYYSSEKETGYGDQDLYEINFIYRQKTNLVIKGLLLDENGAPIKGEITLIDERNKELQGVYASNKNNGKYILVVNPMVNYSAHIQAEGKTVMTKDLYFDFPDDGQTEVNIRPITLK